MPRYKTPEKLLTRNSTGETHTAREWETLTGIPAATLKRRYITPGFPNEDVFTVSVQDALLRGKNILRKYNTGLWGNRPRRPRREVIIR